MSGTNVAVVLAAALVACGWLRIGLRWRPPVAAVVLLGFVVLARPSPSVLRAAVMGVVGLLALSTGSRRQALPALSGAVLALVLLSPELAAEPGFALSTLATGGLLLVAPTWRDRLAQRMPGWLADAIAVPAAAQLACGPVVVAISGQAGMLAVPANLLAVPAVAPATLLGVVAALAAPVALPVAQGAAWLAWLPTHWLVLVARVGARQPGAGVTLPSVGPKGNGTAPRPPAPGEARTAARTTGTPTSTPSWTITAGWPTPRSTTTRPPQPLWGCCAGPCSGSPFGG